MALASASTIALVSSAGAALAGPAPGGGLAAPGAANSLQPYTGNISAFTGNISAFTGNISAFTGNISAFYGDLTASTGNISAFTGNISAFTGNISAFTGNISAFGGNISAFTGNISAFSGAVDPFWGNVGALVGPNGSGSGVIGNPVNYLGIGDFWTSVSPTWSSLNGSWSRAGGLLGAVDSIAAAGAMKTLEQQSDAFWGPAVLKKTGKSFSSGFAKPLYAKYGIDPNSPASFANVSELNRSMFVLDWFDGLMSFTGTDHVDWWMRSANWSPLLTQTQGSGADTKIGLLDFQISPDSVAQGSLTALKGVSSFSSGHGAAVASLLVGPHDGQGVMGIAPRATVVAYNPFDSTGTTNWTDVTKGAAALYKSGVSVMNLSLGMPGTTLPQDWNTVFKDSSLKDAGKSVVAVIAAGNDGAVQTASVKWEDKNPALIVVGSIGPTDLISSFSNTPGAACLSDKASCKADEKLMNRFIVAPGELVLVDDGQGGVTRKIGTSFAAPLVSGAIALIHDRWPWLAKYPQQTANIILGSARDLARLVSMRSTAWERWTSPRRSRR